MPKTAYDWANSFRMSVDSPYISDYFGVWNIHESTFRAAVDRLQGLNVTAHLTSQSTRSSVAARDGRKFDSTDDGIAFFWVSGPTMKAVPSMAEGTSTVRLRQQIKEAKRSSDVRGAMLIMDTPGGTAKGNPDLANEVAAFAREKPIYAFAEDMVASAGVSVASQATKRYANDANALYGAMGTYSVVHDMSGMAAQLGVKVHVVRAGEFKGMGTPGTEISRDQMEEIQRITNALNEGYLSLISRGLQMDISKVRQLADGRIHIATDAVAMGLINGVKSFEETYDELVSQTKSVSGSSHTRQSQSRRNAMDPATLSELKQTFPNSTADWRETQLEANATVSDAAISYAKHVEENAAKERENHAKALEEANAKAASSASPDSLGVKPMSIDDTQDDTALSLDPIEDFNSAVAKVAGPNANLNRRQQAIRSVAKSQPGLHEAFLLATNPGKRQARLISEKLEAANAN